MLCDLSPFWLFHSDEAALVKAARNLGFVFTTRTPETVKIEVVSQHCVLTAFSLSSLLYVLIDSLEKIQ